MGWLRRSLSAANYWLNPWSYLNRWVARYMARDRERVRCRTKLMLLACGGRVHLARSARGEQPKYSVGDLQTLWHEACRENGLPESDLLMERDRHDDETEIVVPHRGDESGAPDT
jgi:hypothetical protein